MSTLADASYCDPSDFDANEECCGLTHGGLRSASASAALKRVPPPPPPPVPADVAKTRVPRRYREMSSCEREEVKEVRGQDRPDPLNRERRIQKDLSTCLTAQGHSALRMGESKIRDHYSEGKPMVTKTGSVTVNWAKFFNNLRPCTGDTYKMRIQGTATMLCEVMSNLQHAKDMDFSFDSDYQTAVQKDLCAMHTTLTKAPARKECAPVPRGVTLRVVRNGRNVLTFAYILDMPMQNVRFGYSSYRAVDPVRVLTNMDPATEQTLRKCCSNETDRQQVLQCVDSILRGKVQDMKPFMRTPHFDKQMRMGHRITALKRLFYQPQVLPINAREVERQAHEKWHTWQQRRAKESERVKNRMLPTTPDRKKVEDAVDEALRCLKNKHPASNWSEETHVVRLVERMIMDDINFMFSSKDRKPYGNNGEQRQYVMVKKEAAPMPMSRSTDVGRPAKASSETRLVMRSFSMHGRHTHLSCSFASGI